LFSRLVYNFITIIITTTIIKKIKKNKKKSKTKLHIKIIIIIKKTKIIKNKIENHTNFNKKTNDKN